MGEAHVNFISFKVNPSGYCPKCALFPHSGESSTANCGKEPSEYFTRLPNPQHHLAFVRIEIQMLPNKGGLRPGWTDPGTLAFSTLNTIA